MSNKKVYLAKSTLASGLDVEYVKSNLLRIPDIEVVEYASGVKPSECSCMVIVPPKDFNWDEESQFNVGRGINMAYEDFVNDHPNHSDDAIFVYTGTKKSKDVESTTPLCINTDYVEEEDKDDFIVVLEEWNDPKSLLTKVSEYMENSDYKAWKQIPRHYQPEPIYSMPSVEKIKECMTKKTTSNISRPLKPEECFNSKGILLLRRRK